MTPASPEISDLVVDYDPVTLRRRPVAREAVVARLLAAGNRRAAAIAARLPVRGALLDDQEVDAVLVRAHLELQRLHEEFRNGERLLLFLRPLIAAVRATRPGPVRVVDVGCGLGYAMRWLAARGGLGPDVTLCGVDYNATLVRAANRLAEAEGLRCPFFVANAFQLAQPATLYTSTGVLHHFRGADLPHFFAEQARSPALGLLHLDIRPSWATPLGAWIFHQARMRDPLARHDGTLSAVRAHTAQTLLAAVHVGAPGLRPVLGDSGGGPLGILHLMQALLVLRPPVFEAFGANLGPLARRLWMPA